MWWLSSLFLLAACGFTPVHQQQSTVAHALYHIDVAPVTGREGQLLVAALEDRLNPTATGAGARYRLSPQLSINYVPMIIDVDGTVSRYRVDLKSPYIITDLATGAIISSNKIKVSASYDMSDEDFANYATAEYQVQKAIEELAEIYQKRLSAFFLSKGQRG